MDRTPHPMRLLLSLILGLVMSSPAFATLSESHGYAQFGLLKYPANFTHFDWVNPGAPKGGTLRVMAYGTFDTLNPYSFKGSSPSSAPNFLQYGVSEFNEPLMVGTGAYDPSGDEPASSYGLIAKSVEYNEDRSWVVFNLREEARFHDGKPITAYDVAFSYRTLVRDGHPQYRTNLQEVKRVDILNRHRIRFVFKRAGNPLLILRLGELPVLPQHYWQGRDFTATTYTPPLGSGPYRITQVVPGKRLVFEKVEDWWGKSLPVNRGKYNFQRAEVEFYRDSDVAFEAFKAGEIQALDVRFSYDINGLLEVDVTLLANGERHAHSIDRSPSGLDEAARAASHARLQGLMIHPRDALPNRTLSARLERAWMQTLGEERERIGTWLDEFNRVLGEQQPAQISSSRQRLNAALDELLL